MSFPESDCNSSSAGTLLGKGSQEAPGNGAEKGVDIRYIREQSAMMGTWGSLQRGFPERLQRVTSTVSRGGGGRQRVGHHPAAATVRGEASGTPGVLPGLLHTQVEPAPTWGLGGRPRVPGKEAIGHRETVGEHRQHPPVTGVQSDSGHGCQWGKPHWLCRMHRALRQPPGHLFYS